MIFLINVSDPDKNFHYIADYGHQVMKEHRYWPLVSNLNNVLSHKPVRFISDNALLEMWFDFLFMFQSMNINRIRAQYLLHSIQCWFGGQCVSDVSSGVISSWTWKCDTQLARAHISHSASLFSKIGLMWWTTCI